MVQGYHEEVVSVDSANNAKSSTVIDFEFSSPLNEYVRPVQALSTDASKAIIVSQSHPELPCMQLLDLYCNSSHPYSSITLKKEVVQCLAFCL